MARHRGLAVFAGGFTSGDVEAVHPVPAARDVADASDSAPLIDRLAQLVEKSLVLVEDGPNGKRWYRQLETIRQFGAARLRTSCEEGPLRERHLQHFMEISETRQIIRCAGPPGCPGAPGKPG